MEFNCHKDGTTELTLVESTTINGGEGITRHVIESAIKGIITIWA